MFLDVQGLRAVKVCIDVAQAIQQGDPCLGRLLFLLGLLQTSRHGLTEILAEVFQDVSFPRFFGLLIFRRCFSLGFCCRRFSRFPSFCVVLLLFVSFLLFEQIFGLLLLFFLKSLLISSEGRFTLVDELGQDQLHHFLFVVHQFEPVDMLRWLRDVLVLFENGRDLSFLGYGAHTCNINPKIELDFVVKL